MYRRRLTRVPATDQPEVLMPTLRRRRQSRDLLHSWGILWIWVLPVVILNISNLLYNNAHALSFTAEGLIALTGWLWIGIACFINGHRCGRIHCRIDGIALPLYSMIAVLIVTHILLVSWAVYSNVGTAIILLSFVAEYMYNRRRRLAPIA
ncbi:MAG: hypothetical protein ACRDL5_08555 [Solirubrobacteraceae bacterium]